MCDSYPSRDCFDLFTEGATQPGESDDVSFLAGKMIAAQ
jgi:hypothetical protein